MLIYFIYRPFLKVKDWWELSNSTDFISTVCFFPQGGEFLWDNVASLQQQGFSVEPGKGTVEAGHKRTITVKWTPYSGYKVRRGLYYFHHCCWNRKATFSRKKCIRKSFYNFRMCLWGFIDKTSILQQMLWSTFPVDQFERSHITTMLLKLLFF